MASIPGLERSPGGRHGTPLQDSCLENPMDRGAWWATVHGISKSRAQLRQLSTHTHNDSCIYHYSCIQCLVLWPNLGTREMEMNNHMLDLSSPSHIHTCCLSLSHTHTHTHTHLSHSPCIFSAYVVKDTYCVPGMGNSDKDEPKLVPAPEPHENWGDRLQYRGVIGECGAEGSVRG